MATAGRQARQIDAASTTAAALDEAIRQLRADNALKAWSVIITFFGDAVVPRGGEVAATTVQALMQRFGIEPGAVRTALSRLVRDGWVVREKRGRQSFYTLSRQGAEPFERATRRIYSARAPVDVNDDQWLVLFNPQADAGWTQAVQAVVPAVRLSSNCVLIDQPQLVGAELLNDSDLLVVRGRPDKVPQWLSSLAGPANIASGFTGLQSRFESMQQLMETEAVGPLDAMAARCLLIHEWRRVLLKSTDLSASMLPVDWPREACRAFVAGFYLSLLPSSEEWLDHQGLGSMTVNTRKTLQRRFS